MPTIYQNGPSSPSTLPYGAALVGGVSSAVLLSAQQPVATGFPLPGLTGATGPGWQPDAGSYYSAGSPKGIEVGINMTGGAQIWLVAALILMGVYIAFEK